MTAYRMDKILLHPDRIRSLCRGEQPSPLQVQLMISDVCNQGCLHCAYRTIGYSSNELFSPNRMLSVSKVQEILDDCRTLGVGGIHITGGGEPTTHPNHVDIFHRIRRSGFDLGVVTNGVHLQPAAIIPLVDPGAETWIRISLDAGTPETYARVRRCSSEHWSLVWKNLHRLVTARAQMAGSPLTIGVSYVVTADNYQEVVEATRRVREVGADHIRITAAFLPSGKMYFAPFLQEAIDLCVMSESLASDTFGVINTFPSRVQDLSDGRPTVRFCGYQHLCTIIGADGNVYRCCVFAYNHRGLVGSLQDQSFATLWMGEPKRTDYANFDARECDHCAHHGKNRAIQSAINTFRHEYFI